MKKYLLIWFMTGLTAELLAYIGTLPMAYTSQLNWDEIAFLFNPYSFVYLGREGYSDAFWVMFVMMHTARLLWLMTASLFEYWSQKFKPAKYLAWLMLCLYFAPSVLFLFA